MNPFRDMDLYKGVIFASVLLLPGAAWWIHKNRMAIEEATKAIHDATKAGGHLERIGRLQKDIQTVENNKIIAGDATRQADLYFETQLFRSGGGLKKGDFQLEGSKEEVHAGKQFADDHIYKVNFVKVGGKDFVKARDFWFAVMFNCESAARENTKREDQLPSIWKLRSLDLVNATAEKPKQGWKTPPPELEDQWIVKELKFARREPHKDK